ncbi:unnamed protein product [Lota lota]
MAVAHLGFSEGSLRRGSPLPLGQLVEESRTAAGPHHLLSSKIYSRLKSNSQIQAEPAALHFNGFSLGKGYQKVLKLINISSEVINIHILPTQTKYFRTTYTKKYRLIPGLAYAVTVHFCPDQWRYFYDCLRVHCKVDRFLFVSLAAHPSASDTFSLTLSPLLSLPSLSLSLPLLSLPSLSLSLSHYREISHTHTHTPHNLHLVPGLIPANGEVAITVTFRPLQYGTCQVTIQLVISQFNTKPYLCTVTGNSAPHLATRTPTPLVPPVLGIKRTTSRKADKSKQAAVKTPPPADVSTPAGVAKMLMKDGSKLGSRDLREAMSCDSIAGLKSRQVKEALFMKKVQGDVAEERANRLSWQQHLGKNPVSEQSKRQILEEREIAVHEYTTKRDRGHQEETVFVSGPPRLSTSRVLRDARQVAEGAPCFQFYCGPQLLVSLRALRLFQQAARKVVVRCRMNRRLACLRKMAAGVKKPSHNNQEHVKENKKMEGLMISPDKILPFSFPSCVNMADHLSLGDFTTVAVALVDITMATHVPLFQLQVPQHFKVMGYSPPLAWEAFNSYVPRSLTRPLRSGALAAGSVGPPRARECQGEAEEPEDEVKVEEAQVAEALLQPVPANPIRIFNPAPGLQAYKPIPKYLETSPELHLCPLPRYPAAPPGRQASQPVTLTIQSSYSYKVFPVFSFYVDLFLLRLLCRSLDLKTDMIPERGPPALTGPSDDMADTLVDRLTEEPALCLTPDMIRAEFLEDEEDQ